MSEIEQTIVLASASPRRRELLDQIRVKYKVLAVDIDESVLINESPTKYVVRMSLEKAKRGFLATEGRYISLGADTCIECDGDVLGKPIDENNASALLHKLSNREHIVHTSIAVVNAQQETTALCSSTVCFDKLEQKTIDAYIATGEPMDKAGAYAIQGQGAQFVTKLKGSYSAVMGLPLYETAQLLQKCGVKII